MLNRWIHRLAFVGLLAASVATMPGCRSTSHGRRGSNCQGCNQSNRPRMQDAPHQQAGEHRHP